MRRQEIGKRVLAADAAVLLLVCALLCYGIPSSAGWRRGRPAIICDLRRPHHGLSAARRLSFSPSPFLSALYLADRTRFWSLRCICSGAGAGVFFVYVSCSTRSARGLWISKTMIQHWSTAGVGSQMLLPMPTGSTRRGRT